MSISAAFSRQREKQSQTSRSSPGFSSTGYSSHTGETINLDPSIRRIQDEALGKYASIYGDLGHASDRFLTQSTDLRGRVSGNSGAFMQARANPVIERFANLRGRVQQDIGRRGLGGSTLGYNALRDIETQAGREEGDARALATQDLAGFEANLNAQELDALNNAATRRAAITGETLAVARERVAQELSAFGLSSSATGSGVSTGQKFSISAGTMPQGGGRV